MLRRVLPIIIFLTPACTGGSEPPDQLTQQASISDCGGFAAGARSAETLDYCDAEVVEWSYDADAEKLTLTDKRVLLNCCGEHSMTAELVDGVYLIEEADAPEDQGRCLCSCVYDYAIEIEDVPAGVISVRIVRDVADDDADPAVVLEDDIDLSGGSGAIVVDESDVGPSCGSSELTHTSDVSECGGFDGGGSSYLTDTPDYCDAEVLEWTYDGEAKKVTLTDERILLNCCGDHSMTAAFVDGVYVIEEADAPVDGEGRCDCLCVFDYSIAIEDIASGVMPVRIMRHVTDSGADPAMIWEGNLDLTQGSGAVVMDDSDVAPWCESSALAQTSSVSECGGFAGEMPLFFTSDTPGYCDAEVLDWSYDADAGKLALVDQRIQLNCCGDHSMTATLRDGVLVIDEVDAPEDGEGRCFCMCVFDFAIEIEGIASGAIPVRIVRDVTDDDADPAVVWEGSLDLTQGSGSVVIDDSEAIFCEE